MKIFFKNEKNEQEVAFKLLNQTIKLSSCNLTTVAQ